MKYEDLFEIWESENISDITTTNSETSLTYGYVNGWYDYEVV
ncbi:MAG: hypothetical protein ACRC5M_07365 [Anaeroplasmataceae bacterium]